jgi:hypothetical protein
MAGLRGALAVAVMTGGVLLGAVACGGSSTVTAPTTAVDGTQATSLPATAPGSATAPSGYPGPSAAPTLTAKDKDFITKVRAIGIKAPDDVVINAAQYVCESDKTNPKSTSLEPIVTGSISPWEPNGETATANAKKFIAEARSSYCKA